MKNEKINYLFFGKLIKQYRQKNGLTQSELCKSLTSVKTLYRIENGEYCNLDNIYNKLASRLGYVFNEFDYQIDLLESYSRTIVDFMKNDAPVKKFSELRERVHRTKCLAVGKLYIYELLDLYDSYLHYYLDGDFSNKNLYYLLSENANYLNGSDYIVCISLLLNYSAVTFYDSFEAQQWIKKIKESNCYVTSLDRYVINMLEDCVEIENKYTSVLNNKTGLKEWNSFFYRYEVYSSLAYAKNNRRDQKGSLECLVILQADPEIVEKLPLYRRINLKKRIGIRYYMLHKYKECISELLGVHEFSKNILGANYCILIKSLEQFTDCDVIETIINDLQSVKLYSPVAKSIVGYYKLKYINKSLVSKLEEYIVERLPHSVLESEIYIDIFNSELIDLIEKSGNHKLLLLYLKS